MVCRTALWWLPFSGAMNVFGVADNDLVSGKSGAAALMMIMIISVAVVRMVAAVVDVFVLFSM